MLEKRAALPSKEQTAAIVESGEKKKKGLSTGAKLLGLGGALAIGLGTGKVQAAGKALKNVMKNPTSGKFDPVGAVKRGWRDMGNAADSAKRIETSKNILGGLESGVVREAGQTTQGLGGTLRKGGWISKNNQVIGNLGESAKANVQAAMKKEMPHLFDDAGKLSLDKLSPEQLRAAESKFLELAKQQEMGALTGGQKTMNVLGKYLPGEKTMIGGLTGMGVAGELGTTQDPSGRQRSLTERLIRGAAVGTAGVALNPLFMGGKVGLIPGMIAFEAGNRGAGLVGGLAGRGTTAVQGGEFGSPLDEVKAHTPFMGGH